MKTTAEQIKVMQACEDGEYIECSPLDTQPKERTRTLSRSGLTPSWNWAMYDYKIKDQTDWSKVAIDTPIFINDQKYYFESYVKETNNVSFYTDGRDSRTFNPTFSAVSLAIASICRLDHDAIKERQKPQWIENTGVEPDFELAVFEMSNGKTHISEQIEFSWDVDLDCRILRYIILK